MSRTSGPFPMFFRNIVTYISNGDICDEDMIDITDWTDGDNIYGVSTQVTFDSKSCMKLDSGNNTAGSSLRVRDIGTFGNRTVFSMNLYHEALGTRPFNDGDSFAFSSSNGTTHLLVCFATDGLFVFKNGYNEIGTDLVSVGVWQQWTFDVNWITQTVDIYQNNILKVSGADCSYTGEAPANGVTSFTQIGQTNINRISYVDYFKAGSDFSV